MPTLGAKPNIWTKRPGSYPSGYGSCGSSLMSSNMAYPFIFTGDVVDEGAIRLGDYTSSRFTNNKAKHTHKICNAENLRPNLYY